VRDDLTKSRRTHTRCLINTFRARPGVLQSMTDIGKIIEDDWRLEDVWSMIMVCATQPGHNYHCSWTRSGWPRCDVGTFNSPVRLALICWWKSPKWMQCQGPKPEEYKCQWCPKKYKFKSVWFVTRMSPECHQNVKNKYSFFAAQPIFIVTL
jgi:hypothetical protein